VTARTELIVAAAQPAVVAGDLAATVAAHAAAVRASGARLVVFPELSLTGYDLDAPALDPADPALLPLVDACRDAGAVALAGAPVELWGAHRIGVLVVTAAGARPVYAKMCLGGDEPAHFVAGDRAGVVEVDGWRVGVGVCKDTRILEHLQQTRAETVDLYVAGLVHAPEELREFEQRARRIAGKLHVPVVFAGYAGRAASFGDTSGGSGIWDAEGRLLAQAGPEPGAVITATLAPAPRPAPPAP